MSHQRAPDRVRVSGPLARFADGFRVDLLERGYSLWGAQEQLYLLAHVSRWMEVRGARGRGVDAGGLERYFVWRRRQGYRQQPLAAEPAHAAWLSGRARCSAAATTPFPRRLIGCLGSSGTICCRSGDAKASSAGQYEPTARLFLRSAPSRLRMTWRACPRAEVSTFVLRESRRRSQRSTETVVYALRALLRFLHVHGLIAEPLVEAVPSVARRREDLPRGLAGRAGDAAVGQLRSLNADRASRLRDPAAAVPAGAAPQRGRRVCRSTTSTGGRARS